MTRFATVKGAKMDMMAFEVFGFVIAFCRSHTKKWQGFGLPLPLMIQKGYLVLDELELPTLFIGRYAVIVTKIKR